MLDEELAIYELMVPIFLLQPDKRKALKIKRRFENFADLLNKRIHLERLV